jgi:hypothetical protein
MPKIMKLRHVHRNYYSNMNNVRQSFPECGRHPLGGDYFIGGGRGIFCEDFIKKLN